MTEITSTGDKRAMTAVGIAFAVAALGAAFFFWIGTWYGNSVPCDDNNQLRILKAFLNSYNTLKSNPGAQQATVVIKTMREQRKNNPVLLNQIGISDEELDTLVAQAQVNPARTALAALITAVESPTTASTTIEELRQKFMGLAEASHQPLTEYGTSDEYLKTLVATRKRQEETAAAAAAIKSQPPPPPSFTTRPNTKTKNGASKHRSDKKKNRHRLQ